MSNKKVGIHKGWIRIAIASVLMASCFVVNRIINQHGSRSVIEWIGYITWPIIVICIYHLFKGISMLFMKQEQIPMQQQTGPIKIWSREEFFAYLEGEFLIDLIVDSTEPIEIRITGEYISPVWNRDGYFTKEFYINEQLYSSFDEFKKEFNALHPDQEIRIMSATNEDGPVDFEI